MAESVLSYKGYQGSVIYDDGALIIKVLHIRDLVSDECTDSTQVEATFRELVDEYLEDCLRLGREPDRPYKGSFNVRIDPGLHKRAAMKAARENCSLNDLVASAIQEYVDRPHLARGGSETAHGMRLVDLVEYSNSLRHSISEGESDWSTLMEHNISRRQTFARSHRKEVPLAPVEPGRQDLDLEMLRLFQVRSMKEYQN